LLPFSSGEPTCTLAPSATSSTWSNSTVARLRVELLDAQHAALLNPILFAARGDYRVHLLKDSV
jgi:hypothetical protein